jgi:hypothetical protein
MSDGTVRLSPSLLLPPSLPLPQCADTFPNRHQQRVVFAGHVLMVALCCGHLCLAYQTGQIRQRAGEREVLTVLELGDWVRIPPDGEVRKIVAFGPGEFVTTQLGDRHLPAVNTEVPDLILPKHALSSVARIVMDAHVCAREPLGGLLSSALRHAIELVFAGMLGTIHGVVVPERDAPIPNSISATRLIRIQEIHHSALRRGPAASTLFAPLLEERAAHRIDGKSARCHGNAGPRMQLPYRVGQGNECECHGEVQHRCRTRFAQ